jgi:N utilization substance protein A
MEALTAVAPLSALQEYGLDADVEAKLLESGINTVEKLGEMTPEQLEEIPGIGAEMVEKIQLAVINYYGQYDQGEGEPAAQEAGEEVPEAAFVEGEAEGQAHAGAEEVAEASENLEIESDKIETPEAGAIDEEHAGSGAHTEEPV